MLKSAYINYRDGETLLEGFVAYSSEEKKPLVILCHAWKGRDDFICDKAKEIAAWGYVGFALDVFGKGVVGNNRNECLALKKPFLEDRHFLQTRLLQGYEQALSLPYVDTTCIAVLGFGFGGLCALDLARAGVSLQGAISNYGHFDAPKNCPQQPIQTNILIAHGYNDPVSPLHEVSLFEEEIDRLGIDWQTHLYGNTYHGFATPSANDPENGVLYNPLSAKRAWNEVERFLKECF